MEFRIDDSVGAELVRLAGEALEQQGVDQAGWEDQCCDIVANAWEAAISERWPDLTGVRLRCRKQVYARGLDDIDIVCGQTSSPLAVFEAKRWGRPALIAPDIKKLLTLPADVEKFLLFYGGFRRQDVPPQATSLKLEEIVRHDWLVPLPHELRTAKKRTADNTPILNSIAFRLDSPELRVDSNPSLKWSRGHDTQKNRYYPWYYTIMLRVERNGT